MLLPVVLGAFTALAAANTNTSLPVFGDITLRDVGQYMMAGKPIAYIFSEDANERALFARQLLSLAEKYSDRLSFVTSSLEDMRPLAREANLMGDIWPAFTIHDVEQRLKYPLFEQGDSLKSAAIERFVEDFVAGTLKPFVKSQPIPEPQEGPVTIVVAKNYEEIVLDEEKDVLLVYYNPTCGPCKALAPRLDKLGELFRGSERQITIAKIDETANDVPHEIPLWPIIRLFKARDKTSYVDFGGNSEPEELAAWIREHGNNHIDVLRSTVASEGVRRTAGDDGGYDEL